MKCFESQSPLLFNTKTDLCDDCVAAVSSIRESALGAQSDHIPKLRSACDQYTTPGGVCTHYIDSVNNIYNDIIGGIGFPRNTCKNFRACPLPVTSKLNVVRSTINKDEPDCFLCKQVLKLVYKVIENQPNADIKSALDKVCDTKLPKSNRKICYKYVDTYTSYLTELIQTNTSVDVACHKIGVCEHEENLTSRPTQLNLTDPTILSSVDCDSCKKSVAGVSDMVKSYATSLSETLKNTCSKYQSYLFCIRFMRNLFDSDISELISKTSSDYLCTKIFGLCDL
ncbi:prosaposin-like [Panonychus citri]|uniref:prosaposin-like n=1 Tax=Panonychus citri TaxID=50023 RepID=UPI002306FE56|nr:prosaposin-like [Panonychus citri]